MITNLMNDLVDFKRKLHFNFSDIYVSFTTIPTMSLEKFNKWNAHKDVATTCCKNHAEESYTHDYWAVKKFNSSINLDVTPIPSQTQKSLNENVYNLNHLIRVENKNRQPGFITHALTVDLEKDTLKKKIHIPKSKHRKNHANSVQHEKKHVSYITYEKNLADGIHPLTCIKLKWLDLIFKTFEQEYNDCKEMPKIILSPDNLDGRVHEEHFYLSASIADYSKISVFYNFFAEYETKKFFDIINTCDIKWEKTGSRETFCISPYSYSYTGHSHEPHEQCHPIISEMMKRISSVFKCELNSVLLNRYNDGDSGVHWHQDDEPELGNRPSIFSLSLGDTRTFEIKRKNVANSLIKFQVCNGTLIVMKGDMQRQWHHRVPLESSTGVRINLTFRLIHKKN